MKIQTAHYIFFVLLTFFSCHNKSGSPQTLTAVKPVFDDGYPTQVSDVMLDSLYDFYFWLHHRDVTDRAIARFKEQLKIWGTQKQIDTLSLLRGHRRLAVAYMMAYDEPHCIEQINIMLKIANQLPYITAEEQAKTLAVQAYRYYWFDLNNPEGLVNMDKADSLMQLAVSKHDLRSVQMSILKSDYLNKSNKQAFALKTLDSAIATLNQLPIAYPSVDAWAKLLRTFVLNSSVGFKFSSARAYFDSKKWENHPITGMVYVEAVYYFVIGLQVEDLEKANMIFQKTLHPNHLWILLHYEIMVEIYYGKREIDKALEYTNLLIINPKSSKVIAYSLAAKIYAELNQGVHVEECAQKVAQNINKIKVSPQAEAEAYHHLWFSYNVLKKIDKSIFWGEKTLRLYEKIYGIHSLSYNDIAYNLGYQYAYYKNDFENGLYYVNKALESIAYDENDRDLEKVNSVFLLNLDYLTLCTILSLKFRQDKDSLTYAKVEHALTVQRHILERSNALTQGKALKSLSSDNIQQNDWAISRNIAHGNKEKAFYHAERFKLMLMRGRTSFIPSVYNIPQHYSEREAQLRTELVNLRKKITEQGESEEWKNQIASKIKEINALIVKLEIQYPKYYKLKYNSEPDSLATIQREVLDDQTALIEYFVGDSTIYVFTVLKNDLKALEIKKPKDFSKTIENFRNEIIRPQPIHDATNFAKKSTELYDLLLRGCLETLPKSVNKLIIAPDDVLSYLPFEILIPNNKQSSDFRKNDFLLKHYQISYAYSANLLLEQKRAKKHDATQVFAGFAPKYEDKDTLISAANITSRAALTRDGAYELKGAKDEVNAISQLINGKIFAEASATEGAFKQEANRYKILHFAMHSLTDDKEPMFSKLLFTMNPKDTTQDGDLTAGELYAMQFNADLAVLSACNTGFGAISRGEGVMSLARAFTYAGVPATVTSLWKVPDITTKEIMVEFYKNLKQGMTKDAALRQAKLTYLTNAPESIAANPYFWAGFVPMGNMEAMDFSEPIAMKVAYILAGLIALWGLGSWFYQNRKKR